MKKEERMELISELELKERFKAMMKWDRETYPDIYSDFYDIPKYKEKFSGVTFENFFEEIKIKSIFMINTLLKEKEEK